LLGCGGLTYVFYVVCQYIAARMPEYDWLAILSGAVLGVGAGLFWTAQVRVAGNGIGCSWLLTEKTPLALVFIRRVP
jgi:hypothetical protein